MFQGRSDEEKKALKQALQKRIDNIRNNCSQLIHLDINDLIGQNEAMGWSLPQGFLEFVELQDGQQIMSPTEVSATGTGREGSKTMAAEEAKKG